MTIDGDDAQIVELKPWANVNQAGQNVNDANKQYGKGIVQLRGAIKDK